MRILLSCLQDVRPHRIPAYRFWADYFRQGIVEVGHEWVEVPGVDWAEGITPATPAEQSRWRTETWSRTLDFLAAERTAGRSVDCFLSYLYPVQVDPGAIREIRRLGIPCVNFFCDNVREFTRVPQEYEPFDLHWVPEFEALSMYRRAGLKYVHAPMPVWVAPEDRKATGIETDDVVFIGSEDLLRRKLLGDAIKLDAPLKIYGGGWGVGEATVERETSSRPLLGTLRNQADFIRQRGVGQWLRKTARTVWPVSPTPIPTARLAGWSAEYVRLTKESQVVLGINRVPTFSRPLRKPLTYSRLRDIEAPMMGACYLTEWTAGLAQWYELETEIATYQTAEEMASKIRELQADPHRRQEMRRRGQQRALNELGVGQSIEKIRALLGLKK